MQNNQNWSNRNNQLSNIGFLPNPSVMQLTNLGAVAQYGGNRPLQQGISYISSTNEPKAISSGSSFQQVNCMLQPDTNIVSQDLYIEFCSSMTPSNKPVNLPIVNSGFVNANANPGIAKPFSFKKQNDNTSRIPLELMQLGGNNKEKAQLSLSNKINISQTPSIKEAADDVSAREVRVLSGSIERIIKWHRINMSGLNLYEVVSRIISIQNGDINFQKILLLRDIHGPILQVIYYDTDYSQPPVFSIGQMIRCIGNMIGQNILRASNIREALDEELNLIRRLCSISEHTVNRILSNECKSG